MARGLSVVFRRQPTRLSRLVFNAALRIGRHFEQEERNVVQSNREHGTTRLPTPWPREAPGISARCSDSFSAFARLQSGRYEEFERPVHYLPRALPARLLQADLPSLTDEDRQRALQNLRSRPRMGVRAGRAPFAGQEHAPVHHRQGVGAAARRGGRPRGARSAANDCRVPVPGGLEEGLLAFLAARHGTVPAAIQGEIAKLTPAEAKRMMQFLAQCQSLDQVTQWLAHPKAKGRRRKT